MPLSQVAALQGRQLGRSLAGVLSGAAANLRSRLAGIAADTGGAGGRISGPRGSPSPPLNKREDRVSFSLVHNSFTFYSTILLIDRCFSSFPSLTGSFHERHHPQILIVSEIVSDIQEIERRKKKFKSQTRINREKYLSCGIKS